MSRHFDWDKRKAQVENMVIGEVAPVVASEKEYSYEEHYRSIKDMNNAYSKVILEVESILYDLHRVETVITKTKEKVGTSTTIFVSDLPLPREVELDYLTFLMGLRRHYVNEIEEVLRPYRHQEVLVEL